MRRMRDAKPQRHGTSRQSCVAWVRKHSARTCSSSATVIAEDMGVAALAGALARSLPGPSAASLHGLSGCLGVLAAPEARLQGMS